MTTKLYALKTSDTGEWVRRNPFNNKYYVRPDATIYQGTFTTIRKKAILDTGHPCKWVEVWVIEAKAVDDAVIDNLNEYGPVSDDNTDNSSVTWGEGFRACLRYLWVGVTVEAKKRSL